MMIVTPEKSSHWYTKTGKPCYEVPNKSKPGSMRRVTLRDARKLNLYPSVTTITSMLAKPGLEAWKIEQAILATLTLPKNFGEPEQEYLARIVEDSRSISKDAAGLGTQIHKCIQKYHDDKLTIYTSKYSKELRPIMDGYCNWADEYIRTVIGMEIPFAYDGYGGKIDTHFEAMPGGVFVIGDYKTQATKPGEKVKSYPEHGIQLAAYANGRGLLGSVLLWNIIISTTEPGRIEIVDWTDTGQQEYETFNHLLSVWMHLNSYDPRENNDEH